MPIRKRYTAFVGTDRVASGSLQDVALALQQHPLRGAARSPLVFDDATGRQIDLDPRKSHRDQEQPAVVAAGRPRLGVIAREVTLLPRHWEWLSDQPGGASVALRRLVDEARHAKPLADQLRRAREATFRFLTAVAGNLPGYEEVLRALFAGDRSRFDALVRDWPVGVCLYAMTLSHDAFEGDSQ
jgi:hypothetical protein